MLIKSRNSPDPIIGRLRALVQNSPELKSVAQVYEAILPLLRDADLDTRMPVLNLDEVRTKIEKGIPLLHDLDIELDVEAVQELMIKLAAAIEESKRKNEPRRSFFARRSESRPAEGVIREAIESNRLYFAGLLKDIIAGKREAITAAAERHRLDPDLLRALAENALKPALRACRRQLSQLVGDIHWNKGTCFVCGATAIFAELQGNGQVKHLRCGTCGADWESRRLQCVHCGNEDHDSQQHLYPEKDKGKTRVEVCEKCRRYLKVLSAFCPTPDDMLVVEDLATMHMNYIAEEYGYARTAVS